MIEREKGKDQEKMLKKKVLGQPVVVKERKGNKTAASRKGQRR